MASSVQEWMLKSLSPSVASSAVDLTSEGSREYAFPVLISREVFDSLVSQGFVVLGGDLWKKEKDGFSACGESWFSESSSPSAARGAWFHFFNILPEGGDYYVTFVVR